MHDNQKLLELLALDKLVERSIPFPEFLQELKGRPEAADTAAALIVRAIKARGEVDIASVSPERQPYVTMLKQLGIPNYRAFEQVRGSQRLVARIMKFLEAAAQNGYQLRQMITIVGGPGCGKSFLADAFKATLEGQTIFAVQGCPVHENPINLLKLLKPEQLKALAEALGMGNTLHDYLKVAGEPCAHCWQQAMKNGDSEPNLGKIKVDELRISSRHGGVATWMASAKGQSCSLLAALRQGSRGMVDMPEAFSVVEAAAGEARELELLLEATENRRIPSGSESCSKTSGYLPLDAVIFAQSNEGAWDRFLDSVPEEDRGKWTRRAKILKVPYNTSRSEEVQAYLDFLQVMKARPHLDPLALSVAATLAVASRMKKDGDVPLDLRVRMYDGERIVLPKKQSSVSSRLGTEDRWGSIASASTRQDPTTESKNVTVSDLWDAAGEDEGLRGLNMGLMLSIVSQVCELALSSKEKCVTALSMMKYLRARIELELKTPGLTKEEEAMLTRCKDELLSDFRRSTTGLVEKEYRRMLRAQFLRAFSPDYEMLATQTFERYYMYARAFAKGDAEVFDKRFGRKVKVETGFMEEIERLMGLTSVSEREDFRRALEAEFLHLREMHAKEHGADAEPPEINWRTHPQLAKAIARKLNDEIAKKVQRLLTDEIQLNEEEAKLRAESLQRFEELGYTCAHCRKAALEYFKEFKLWNSSDDER
jgi:predicted Ser/Thr protein kinase